MVPLPDGTRLHYLHDPSGRNGAAGVVHRDEIYDMREDGAWVFHAPQFGIPFGARQISVFVELADTHPVRPDGYRQFLRWRDSHQHHVEAPQFAKAVATHRPDWLLTLVESLSPDARQTDAVRDELADLLQRLRIRRTRPRPTTPITVIVPAPAQIILGPPPPPVFDAEPPPEIVPLRDLDDIAERGLAGRGGRFYLQTHQLFVNMRHLAASAMAQALVHHFATQPDQERVRSLATEFADAALVRRIGRSLVHAMAWRDEGHAAPFAGWEIEQAVNVPALSLAAEDYAGSMPAAVSAMEKALAVPPLRRRRHVLPRMAQPGEVSRPPPRTNRALVALLTLRATRR